MNILSNRVLDAGEFVEAYLGMYCVPADTFNECKNILCSNGVFITNGYKLTDIPKLAQGNYVIVQFSTEKNYIVYEYRVMPIQKKYLSSFKTNLAAQWSLR